MHAHSGQRGLLVCYVPGVDLRRLEAGCTPFLARLLAAYRPARLRAQATHANAPTLLTGVNPQGHGAWGPRLKPDWQRRSTAQRLLDQLPDLATTTAQGLAHLVRKSVDLATMPPRRRRRFVWCRHNMKAVRDPERATRVVNGVPSLLDVVPRSRYTYVDDYWRLDEVLEKAGDARFRLEIIANHALDYLQHWNMHDETRIERYYRGIDNFVEHLHARCERDGRRFVMISDHGQEPVTRIVDPRPLLTSLDLPPDSFDSFIEYAKMTLWLHSAAARVRVLERLNGRDEGVLVLREDLRRYDVDFADRSFGDALFYLEPGASFFPNDFYQPLANLVLSAKKRGQRGRLRRPWHQGEHGYLPEHACEAGFMVTAVEGVRTITDREEVALIDVAPSLLALLGMAAAPTMPGRAIFEPSVG